MIFMDGESMKKGNLGAILGISVCLTLLLAFTLKAREQPNRAERPILTVRTAFSPEKVTPGETFELSLELTVASGFHINSQKPEDELLVPTSVELKKDTAYEVKEIIFPEAKKKKFNFSDKPLSVYEGQVKIILRIEPAEGVCGSSLELEGKIRYQACDQEACLRPQTVPFKASVKIAS